MDPGIMAALIAAGTAIPVAFATAMLNHRYELKKLQREEKLKVQGLANKYSGVILLSASDLQDRLWHLCQKQASLKSPVLLMDEDEKPVSKLWPMTKKHYLISTCYLFARFFCWVEILQTNMRFLDFGEDQKTNQFNYHLKRIERSLAEVDLRDYAKKKFTSDVQIYQLYQTEIGQSVIIMKNEELDCVDFIEFSSRFESDLQHMSSYKGLEKLMICAVSKQETDFCLARLKLFTNCLVDLIEFLTKETKILSADEVDKVPIPNYQYDDYLKRWPILSSSHSDSGASSQGP